MKKTFLICAAVLSLFACKESKKGIADFSWLQGKWAGAADGAEMFEEWQPANGMTMAGRAFGVAGKDTVFSEVLKLEQRGDDVFYTVNMSENEGPVEFKFTGIKNDTTVFENPQHDFPQRIVYYKTGNDKLYACIDGLNEGKYAKMEFSFTKAK